MLLEGSKPLLICHGVLPQLFEDTQSSHDVRNTDLLFHLLVFAGVEALFLAHFEASTALVNAGTRQSNFNIEP